MRYSVIKPNDVANGEGVCVSLFTQGCPHHCHGCFNMSTWDFDGGKLFTHADRDYIIECISKYGVQRNFSVLGGEPLCPSNVDGVRSLCKYVKSIYPSIKIYVWSGYVIEDLITMYGTDLFIDMDYLIDGQFIEQEKDIQLKLRGSKNQRVFNLKTMEQIYNIRGKQE